MSSHAKKMFKIQVYKHNITDKPDKKIRFDTTMFWGISSQELGFALHSVIRKTMETEKWLEN